MNARKFVENFIRDIEANESHMDNLKDGQLRHRELMFKLCINRSEKDKDREDLMACL